MLASYVCRGDGIVVNQPIFFLVFASVCRFGSGCGCRFVYFLLAREEGGGVTTRRKGKACVGDIMMGSGVCEVLILYRL